MTIPTYTDAQVERRVSELINRGKHHNSAQRWGQLDVFTGWMEQVKLLTDSEEEKNRLIELATDKMINEKKLNQRRLEHHTFLVMRYRTFNMREDNTPQNITETKCWQLTYIALLVVHLALNLWVLVDLI